MAHGTPPGLGSMASTAHLCGWSEADWDLDPVLSPSSFESTGRSLYLPEFAPAEEMGVRTPFLEPL